MHMGWNVANGVADPAVGETQIFISCHENGFSLIRANLGPLMNDPSKVPVSKWTQE
jgi:hypothetical protein